MADRTVVGLDPSFTTTGIAVIREGVPWPDVELVSVRSSGHRDDSYGVRCARANDIANRVIAYVRPTDALVVMEGPSLRSNSPGTWDRAGLWWDLYRRLTALGVPIGICPPKTRAKFGCGNGNAAKPEVTAGVRALWDTIARPRNPDEADGLAMATMAAQIVGIEVPRRSWHADCLKKVAMEVAA